MKHALLVLLLTSCAKLYSLHAGELVPSVVNTAPEQRLALWQRAVVVLLDQGYVPQVLNESAGYISAHRRDDLVDDELAGTLALVTISPQGVVRVALAGAGTFHSEADFIKAMGDRQNMLAGLIAH
jgi:hypothetical protein